MYCQSCGTECNDTARFCPTCGAVVSEGVAWSDPNQVTPAGVPYQSPGMTPEYIAVGASPQAVVSAPNPQNDGSRNKMIAIIAGVVIALAIIGAIAAVFLMGGSSSANLVEVPISIAAPSYNDATDTPFSFHVTGKADDGESVNTDVYTKSDGVGLSLKPGTYTIKPTASPLLASGVLYKVPSNSAEVKVAKDGVSPKPSFSYSGVAAADIAASDLDLACSTALAAGAPSDKVTSIRQAIEASVQEATRVADTTKYPTYYVSASDFATLRSTPSTSADAITTLPYNTAVSYVETSENGFYKVFYLGKEGYVLSEFLSASANPTKNYTGSGSSSSSGSYSTSSTMYVCANQYIHLRVSPSTSARSICTIYSRSAVTYLGDAGNGFSKVRYNGNTGYVISKFISSDRNAPLVYDAS